MDSGDQVSLSFPDANTTLSTWSKYSFNSNFLTPTDGWSFTAVPWKGTPNLENLRGKIGPGARVQLVVNGHPQAAGYVDSIEFRRTRHGGSEVELSGRDTLSYAVDAHVDPAMKLSEGMTLADGVQQVFERYGFSTFLTSNADNVNIAQGTHGLKNTSKQGHALKTYKLHQLKPYANEGVFAFGTRISQRHGLWIWATVDGDGLVLGRPDFDQEPRMSLVRRLGEAGNQNNVVDGRFKLDGTDQPSVILASGYGGGGEFAKSSLRVAIVNPLVDADISDIRQKYEKKVPFVPHPLRGKVPPGLFFKAPHARPLYVHDDESKDQSELEAFAQRMLSLHLRKAITATYTVYGHSQRVGGESLVWAVDTMVNVVDDVAGIRFPMWVMARTFSKDRHSGTTTKLELILPYTLSF